MIRSSRPDELEALIKLAIATGLSAHDETEGLENVLTEYFDGKLGSDHFWITDDADGPVGVAYFAPERMTDGTWNLFMIAVHPDFQRQGRGASLVRHAEETVVAHGGRIMLIETSSLPEFEQTQAFYRQCGYHEEARIREFWKAGDDKIIFRKVIAARNNQLTDETAQIAPEAGS